MEFKLLDRGEPVTANEFWLSDDEWAAIEPLIPMHRPGVKPRNSRRIIIGILHVLKTGGRGRDCSAVFGPHTTVYNRFNRWSRAAIWHEMFERLVQLDHAHEESIDCSRKRTNS